MEADINQAERLRPETKVGSLTALTEFWASLFCVNPEDTWESLLWRLKSSALSIAQSESRTSMTRVREQRINIFFSITSYPAK